MRNRITPLTGLSYISVPMSSYRLAQGRQLCAALYGFLFETGYQGRIADIIVATLLAHEGDDRRYYCSVCRVPCARWQFSAWFVDTGPDKRCYSCVLFMAADREMGWYEGNTNNYLPAALTSIVLDYVPSALAIHCAYCLDTLNIHSVDPETFLCAPCMRYTTHITSLHTQGIYS